MQDSALPYCIGLPRLISDRLLGGRRNDYKHGPTGPVAQDRQPVGDNQVSSPTSKAAAPILTPPFSWQSRRLSDSWNVKEAILQSCTLPRSPDRPKDPDGTRAIPDSPKGRPKPSHFYADPGQAGASPFAYCFKAAFVIVRTADNHRLSPKHRRNLQTSEATPVKPDDPGRDLVSFGESPHSSIVVSPASDVGTE
jgi:hypothetical protein